jgi:hypothetical protein
VIGDQLELGSVMRVREATSLAGIVDPARRQRCPARNARDMRAGCLRETAVERIAKQLSSGSVLKNAFLNAVTE